MAGLANTTATIFQICRQNVCLSNGPRLVGIRLESYQAPGFEISEIGEYLRMTGKRLFHRIASQIAELIDRGEFPKGARLPGERELAERFGVSRVTVREAEIALQAVGRIDIKTGSGVYVCEDQPADQQKLPPVSTFELTEARSLIEGEAAALAAKHITDQELEKLQQLTLKMASSDKEISNGADREFHATIAKASRNLALIHVVETLWRMRDELPEVKKMYDSVCNDNVEARGNEHQEILDALVARSSSNARKAMRQHFQRLIGTLLDASEKQAFEEVQQQVSKSRERFLSSVPPLH